MLPHSAKPLRDQIDKCIGEALQEAMYIRVHTYADNCLQLHTF